MGKAGGFLTPKAIANRIKSKGLQKLRWYCQLCQKQCRDENGFKCHCNSESHKRQMMVFGQDPEKVVDTFSEEFEESFMRLMKMSHPHSRVQAKIVWNEFIADKHHVHMNSTKWTTLTEFVKYLGREGKCKVEETEKGWFIKLIHKNAQQELEEQRKAKRERHEREEEMREARALQEQIERAQKGTEDAEPAPTPDTELRRGEEAEPLSLAVDFNKRKPAALRPAPTATKAPGFGDEGGGTGRGRDDVRVGAKRKPNVLEELMKKDQEQKAAKRVECWLMKGVVVKVVAKELKSAGYYKAKGVVDRIVDGVVGELTMLDSGDVLRVDQRQLETVIPQPGGLVQIVNGAYRGSTGKLLSVNVDKFKAELKVLSGTMKGEVLWLDYEDFSKKFEG